VIVLRSIFVLTYTFSNCRRRPKNGVSDRVRSFTIQWNTTVIWSLLKESTTIKNGRLRPLLIDLGVTQPQRTMIFLKCGVGIVPGSRCYVDHFYNDQLTSELLNHILISKADRWKIDADIRSMLFSQKASDFADPTFFSNEESKYCWINER